MEHYTHVSTGWKSLDHIIDHLRKGDNVVWQVDRLDDYQRLVSLFVNQSLSRKERVVYVRFARHKPLLEERPDIAVYHVKLDQGFEAFSVQIHEIIAKEGRDVHYVFDALSDLLHVWATDLMIGDFFYITCPYLFELNTIAYFAVMRNRHSYKAIARIRETTQLLIDVYSFRRQLCIHPLKVKDRYAPTMFLPHIKKKEALIPVMDSVEASRLFADLSRRRSTDAQPQLDYWERLFMQTRDMLDSDAPAEEKQDMVEQLSRLLLSRDKRLLDLIRTYFSLEDFLAVKQRLIGTGFIGGKSLGMLLARNILCSETDVQWRNTLEPHDSYYIGSDVFYSYIVQNGLWKLFLAHRTETGYLARAAELKERLLTGSFPGEIKAQFERMLEYYGQSPIIVRSSSLLEDAFGSAFSGKYDSFFLTNQGSPEERYEHFETAVRRIFAGTMNEDALAYRIQRGLDRMTEQMALLVQRVSGAYRKDYFYPEIAGVGLSRNPFAWKKDMDQEAGMLRLVFGLGTRAVNRVDTDYPRIVAVDDPLARPMHAMKDIRKFSQRHVDVLNLRENGFQTRLLRDLIREVPDDKIPLLAVRDTDALDPAGGMSIPDPDRMALTFDPFLTETPFIGIMKRMLRTLETRYNYPVDIEFTVNFTQSDELQINLLQCRPFQHIGGGVRVEIPDSVDPEHTIIRTEGDFMGGDLSQAIARIVFVDPQAYTALTASDKYGVARLIGKINKQATDREKTPTLLLGPGRWGTHSPAMGVPVTFSEINHMAVLGEISYQDGSLIPDLSFGTHFFQDLVETRIFYIAVYPEKPEVMFNADWIRNRPNILERLCPGDTRLGGVVMVCDTGDLGLVIRADITRQRMICYLNPV